MMFDPRAKFYYSSELRRFWWLGFAAGACVASVVGAVAGLLA
jgi:hypothetical protein